MASVGDAGTGLNGAGTRSQWQQQPRFGRPPNIGLDPTVILWVPVAQAFLTKALVSVVRKHQAKEIAEVGEAGISKGG